MSERISNLHTLLKQIFMFGELTPRQWKHDCEPWQTRAGCSQTVPSNHAQ